MATRLWRLADRTRVWLEHLASRRLGAVVLFVTGIAVYAVRAIAWPLSTGRDLDEYLYAWVQLFDRDVLLPWSLLFRTPLTPIVNGLSLDVFGGALAEPIFAVLFALSVVCWSAAARFFGPRVALVTAVALLAYPGYGAMFHEVSSEAVFGAGFALWALLVTRASAHPSVARFALAGLGVALLALIRPGNAVLLVFALSPLAVPGTWRERALWAGAFAAAAVVPLVGWSLHNGIRFGDYTLARGGNAIIPFYRAFITDHIVSPENGPASRRLAGAMERDLVTREPYRSYGVTANDLFRRGSYRAHEDLYLLSDAVFGWESDYAVLRDAGLEGVRAHPAAYASGVWDTIWHELSTPYYRTVAAGSTPSDNEKPASAGSQRLPAPGDGEPIPAGQVVWLSTPDQRIRQVWTSPTEWHLEYRYQQDRQRLDQILKAVGGLVAALPDRSGNAWLAKRLDQLSRWFPRPWLWMLAGLFGVALRRPHGWRALIALALAAVLVVVVNALGLFADLHFILPVAPAFVLLGVGGLLGSRDPARAVAKPS